MDDVFAREDPPPSGWMRAIFDDGPYADDVGRCVPGPPPAKTLVARRWRRRGTYRLLRTASWNDPGDPVALYVAGGRWRVMTR